MRGFYESGAIKKEWFLRSDAPANGWSLKEFYESGHLKMAESYSHSLVIEQVFYNEGGEITAHKIYSHSQKKLIDKPKQAPLPRPNVVTGTAHMGFYFHHLPDISKFIGAEYDEAALEKAYREFINTPFSYHDLENSNDDWEDPIVSWVLEGTDMSFIIGFEHGEGYYQWLLYTKTEEDYERAKQFMNNLFRD